MGIIKLRPVPSPETQVRTVAMVDGRLNSADLFRVARMVRIVHGDQVYTLTLTSKNKLILTK
ncbi:hemin uptake protein HemP [Xanthobacter sp. VNH20]|uniref:hemin uptake protein HemP n=1 Tax=Xanthobacter sp. VNH20 TaxID=3156616 RepID=UPI0032B529FE